MRDTFENLVSLSKSDAAVRLNTLPGIPQYISLPRDMPSLEPTEERRCVHEWFQVHAEHSPDRVALYSAESRKVLTYGDLHMSSGIRAHCQCFSSTCTAHVNVPSLAIEGN